MVIPCPLGKPLDQNSLRGGMDDKQAMHPCLEYKNITQEHNDPWEYLMVCEKSLAQDLTALVSSSLI